MSHLCLVLGVLLAARPSFAIPSERDVSIAATLQRARGCKAVPASCDDLDKLLKGYFSQLEIVDKCNAQKCSQETIMAVFRDDEALDRKELALPDAARADGPARPFLLLSLLVTNSAAQTLGLIDPAAKPPSRSDSTLEAQREVEHFCMDDTICPDARKTLDAVVSVRTELGQCGAQVCAYQQLTGFAARLERAMSGYTAVSNKYPDVDASALFALIGGFEAAVANDLALDSTERCRSLESKMASLEGDLDGYSKSNPSAADIALLKSQVAQASTLFSQATIGMDDVENMTGKGMDSDPYHSRINAAAIRLARDKARVLALATANGLAPGQADSDRAVTVPAKSGAAAGTTAPGAPVQDQGPRTLNGLDAGLVTSPSLASEEEAPLGGRLSPSQLGQKLLFPSSALDTIIADHALGLTTTVGDPTGRAALVHEQEGNDCDIVGQQEVLLALGVLPPGDPVTQERQLRKEAEDQGFFSDGTPNAFTGELLTAKGVLNVRHSKAPLSLLDAAVRRGGPILATVDARWLFYEDDARPDPMKTWVSGDTDEDLAKARSDPHPWVHAIVVTGAEIARWDGKTLGYYVNDSGNDPPGAAA